MNISRIIIGSDHAGLWLKQECFIYLKDKEISVQDLGTNSEESCDYPEFAVKVSQGVLETNSLGILICGTGLGMCMTANRISNIRAALCTNEIMAKMARKHNNANILCMGARIVGSDLAKSILEAFLHTEFQGDRHQKRIDLIDSLTQS